MDELESVFEDNKEWERIQDDLERVMKIQVTVRIPNTKSYPWTQTPPNNSVLNNVPLATEPIIIPGLRPWNGEP